MLGKLLVSLASLFALFLLIRSFLKAKKGPKEVSIEDTFTEVFKQSSFKTLKDNWLYVSKMETAGWTSPLFVNGNNLWGMKRAVKRPNTQSPFIQTGTPGRDASFFQKFFPNFYQLANEGPAAFITKPLPPAGKLNIGITPEWATYKNVRDSVEDIILWMDYTKFPKGPLSLRDHINEMAKRSYFVGEDVKTYLGKVEAWKNRDIS